MVNCTRVVSKIINNAPKQVKVHENAALSAICDNSQKLAVELETRAMLGKSSVVTNPSKFVDENNFYSEIKKRKFHMIENERKDLKEIAKTNDGLFDTEPIDILKELKLAAKETDEEYASVDITDILRFLKTNGKYDQDAKDRILKFIKGFPSKAAAAKAIRDLRIYKDCNSKIKNEVLDLTIRLHDDFGEQIELLDGEYFSNRVMKMLYKYVKKDLNEAEQLKRIQKLTKIIDKTDDITPLQDLILSTEFVPKKYQLQKETLINRFIDSNILPTKAAVEVFDSGAPIHVIEKFLSTMKPLTNLNINLVSIDKYALDNILKADDKIVLNKIISSIKAEKNPQEIILKISENTLNPSEYGVSFTNKRKITNQIFDKKTNNPVLTEKTTLEDGKIEINAKDYMHNNLISQKLNENIGLVNETIEHFDKKGKLVYKDFITPSNVQGQYDFYRQMADGKIKVKAKSFKDPRTGEVKMIRHLTSPNGTKTKINYSEAKNGSYTYDYVVKTKNGEIIVNNHNKYTVIDENHFVSEVNGQMYDIIHSKGKLIVTPKGKKSVTLDLNKIVPSQDPQIINTIIHLPGNELINLNNLKIRINKFYESDNAAYMGKETTNWFNHFFYDEEEKFVNNICIGEDVKGTLSVLLHEIGHIKSKALSKNDWNKIIEVFQNELKTYRKHSSKTDERLLNYLIDTDHYLNSGKGAIEEAISDILAMRLIPHDKNLGDTAIRGLKFQENFPETIACVDKIFSK